MQTKTCCLIDMIFENIADHDNQITIAHMTAGANMVWSHHATIASAISAAHNAPTGADVYFGVGTVKGTPSGRGKASDISSIGCLWADIDCQSPQHPGAATREQAMALLADMPFAPSVVVDSGWGYHAYWLLDEPWRLDSDIEQAYAQSVTRGWYELLSNKARLKGLDKKSVDPVWDLARIMRMPGTTNHKSEEAMPVSVIEANTYRYSAYDIADFALASKRPTAKDLDIHPDVMIDQDKLQYLLDYSPKFAGSWKHQRDLKSASERDMSLATIAIIQGWSEQDAANLIIHRRLLDGDKKKALRKDYIRLTVAKAAASAKEHAAITGIETVADIAKPLDEQCVVANDYESIDPTDQQDPGEFPPDLFEVPGFVTDYMQWVTSRAASPCPVATFAGSLAMLSWLTGRKICTPGDSRSNFYIIAIGRSGVGKNAPREANSLIMAELGAMASYADEIQTAEGMEDLLLSQPCVLWQPDEFDVLMRNMSREDGQGNGRWEALSKRLRTIYTSSHMTIRGRIRAKAKRDDPDDVALINQPHLVMYASATPRAFLESMSSSQVLDGLLSRCTILPIPYVLIEQEPRAIAPIPIGVIDHARSWREWAPPGNLQDSFPHPLAIQPSKAATDMFREYRRECMDRQQDGECPEVENAILSRAAQTAQKAALLYAASACRPNAQAPTIDAPAAQWGVDFTRAVNTHMLYEINSHLGDSPFAKAQLKVIRFLKSHEGSATKRDVMRLLRAEKDFARIIDSLKKQERIEECQIAGKRRMCDGYRLV